MTEAQTATPPSLSRLLLLAAGGFVVASVVTVTMVLPAEFGRDPTGIGRVLGLTGLAQTEAVAADPSVAADAPGASVSARFYENTYRTDVVDVPLFPKGGTGPNRLEYKVRMRDGGTLIYSWRVQGGDTDGVYMTCTPRLTGQTSRLSSSSKGRQVRLTVHWLRPLMACMGGIGKTGPTKLS